MTGRVLVTGASGFVGGAVVARLVRDGHAPVRAAFRSSTARAPAGAEAVQVGEFADGGSWSTAIRDCSVIVHAGARVHVMHDDGPDPLAEFRAVNVDGTLRLARQAVEAGVRRFVFVSSIKVNGETTEPGRPFSAGDAPHPQDPYGISKLEAELALTALARDTGLEVVIVRPVLVYGPGVKANFREMMRWLRSGMPLPLGAIDNRRSLVAVDNLADLLVTCARHPAAAGGTFLVSDGEDLSTSELLRRTAAALGRPARLVPMPAGLIVGLARLAGRGGLGERLCGSLQVDISLTRERLDWTPPVRVADALARTAAAYLAEEPT